MVLHSHSHKRTEKWKCGNSAHCPLHTIEAHSDVPSFSPAGERLTEKEAEDLMAWMRNALGSRVTGVKVGILCLGN